MGLLALVVATVAVTLAALSAARLTPAARGRGAQLVVAAVVFQAITVFTAYGLGLAGGLTAGTLFASAVGVSLLLLAVTAFVEGGPAAFGDNTRAQLRGLARLGPDLLRACRLAGFPLWLAVTAGLGLIAWFAFAVCFSPPKGNSDALFYHEAIVGFAIQNHDLGAVDLPRRLQRINGMPRFCHMLQLWFAIFTGRTFVELPNVLSHLVAAASTYGLARKVGAQKSAAIAWAFAFTLAPGVLRLTDSIMVDVHTAALVLAASFCAVALRWRPSSAVVAALAVALVVGSKYHVVPLAAALSLVIGLRTLAAYKAWGLPRVAAVVVGTAGIVLAGLAAVFVRNYVLFDNPVWPAGLKIDSLGIDWRAPDSLKNAWTSGKGLAKSRVWDSWFAAPFTSKPWPNPGARVEDYGFVGMLLAMPLSALAGGVVVVLAIVQRVRGRVIRDKTWAMLALAFVGFVGLYTFPSLVRGRYYLPLLGLSFAMVTWWWSAPRLRRAGRYVAFAASVGMALNVMWSTRFGWVIEPADVWARLQVPAAHRAFTKRPLLSISPAVGKVRAAKLKAGMTVGFDDTTYTGILWNDDYSSRVVWLGRSRKGLLKRADELRADWIFLERGGVTSYDPEQTTWKRISDRVMGGRKDARKSWLYERKVPLSPWPDEAR